MAMTPRSLIYPTNFIDCLRKAELEEEQHKASLRPGTPIGKSETEDLNRMLEDAPFDDTELDRLQESPDEWEAFKKEQDERIEREMR